MEVPFLVDFILHIDDHLEQLIAQYHGWVYVILFAIVFVETGVVVMPFLPGDSLLFAAGTFAGIDLLNIYVLVPLLIVAAVIGDSLNYAIGNYIGPKVFSLDYKYINKEYLIKTQHFFEKHGGKAVVLARFMPIIRTFAPFVAGVGSMRYPRFLFYNVMGAVVWVVLFTVAGYIFGNAPVVRDNFKIVILAIIVISVLPMVWEFIQHRRTLRRSRAAGE